VHIVPEWYFLPFYAILRALPSKIGGVFLLLVFILVVGLVPLLDKTNFFRFCSRFCNDFDGGVVDKGRFALFCYTIDVYYRFVGGALLFCFVLLGWLGAQAVGFPFLFFSRVLICVFFLFFFL
jgi:ubiquinol-cytochrome c reductase cytochrome b subunit